MTYDVNVYFTSGQVMTFPKVNRETAEKWLNTVGCDRFVDSTSGGETMRVWAQHIIAVKVEPPLEVPA